MLLGTTRRPRRARGRIDSALPDHFGAAGCKLADDSTESNAPSDLRDLILDGPARKYVSHHHLGWVVLGWVARFGLALFVTIGFAASVGLYKCLPCGDPNLIAACEGVFFWTLALVLAVTQDRE